MFGHFMGHCSVDNESYSMAGEWAIGSRDKGGHNITGNLNVNDLECCA